MLIETVSPLESCFRDPGNISDDEQQTQVHLRVFGAEAEILKPDQIKPAETKASGNVSVRAVKRFKKINSINHREALGSSDV